MMMSTSDSGLRRRRFPLAIFLAALFAGFFGLPDVAFAWGPSVHLWIGDVLIQSLAAVAPLVAALIRRHARSFLYGSLSPDFYVGKGSTYHDEHCHNWTTGLKLLDGARTPNQQAFAYGYLTHLAADVIGHNHFVPNHLYRTFGSKKLGHAYFELHADNLIDPAYLELADIVCRAEHEENDSLLNAVIDGGRYVPFEAKKRLFTSFIGWSNGRVMRLVRVRARELSESLLAVDDVREQIALSLAVAVEMLKAPHASLVLAYDPIGARNICLAKELRREMRRARTFRKDDVPFPIPRELRALRTNLGAIRFEPTTASILLPAPTRAAS
jgi:hypothetical protein